MLYLEVKEMKARRDRGIRSIAQFKKKYLPQLAEKELEKTQEIGRIWAIETIQKLKG